MLLVTTLSIFINFLLDELAILTNKAVLKPIGELVLLIGLLAFLLSPEQGAAVAAAGAPFIIIESIVFIALIIVSVKNILNRRKTKKDS